ncbi:ABC transporter substrate-binding protein [Streptomyces sp. NPDC047028]|uniref:ABC transporter substrate-binding protein n=1 Tax=Streptomyces sp. NPDC047028 TaxID=3155793 RepID=UPI00340E2FDE
MTGRRRPRSTRTLLPSLPRRVRRAALSAGALAACLSLTAGCGTVLGATGGSGDGAPVTVMTWAPQGTGATNKPGMPAIALAYARWVNAHGGVAGHRLRVLTCNDHDNSVGAAACARRAVREGAVAVVGSYSQYADSYMAPLESAGIAYLGGYGVTNDEFTNMYSYPVNGGQPALLAGLGRALADTCGPVSLVRPDSIAGDELPPLLDAGLKAGGHAPAADQLAAEDATEYDGQARRAMRHANSANGTRKAGCVVPALGDHTDTFMDSFRRARDDASAGPRQGSRAVRTATVLGSVDQTVINATGGASGPYEGAYVTGWYPVTSDARWDPMKKVISEEAFGDNRVDAGDAGVQTTWIAYTVLRAVLERIGSGDVTAAAVRHTLDDGLKVSTGGLTPTLSWPFEGRLATIGLSRLANAEVTLQVVRDGRLVAARDGHTATDTTAVLRSADLG